MNRRSLLTTAVAGIAAAGAGCAPASRDGGPGREPQLPGSPLSVLRGGPPADLDRARERLAREGLDGVVVAHPVNVYYLTGYWPATSRMGYEAPLVAVLARDPQQPVILVSAEFTYYYLLSDQRFDWPLEVFLYTGPLDGTQLAAARAGRYASEPPAAPSRTFANAGLVPLSARERERQAAVEAAVRREPASPDRDFALLKALRRTGLDRGRIAVDHDVIRAVFAAADLPATLLPADATLKRMRIVKSEREITLLRAAATANAGAALAACNVVRAGATCRELRTAFYREAAARGNRGVFMVIDGVSAEGVDAPFREGQAFLIDAVSEGAGYHGDFARTVFVGEPPRPMADATAAIKLGWEAVRESLRPGLRFEEITAIGRDAVRRAGYDFTIAFQPHSVGLYHNDAIGLGDLVLEPGMVISVDCPVLQAGIGGTAHLEDLTLITASGAEPVHPVTAPVIQV
ncbi:MAG: aminopeptidase P family protein [Chromatiales bacterium]|jgi:Xaa-Pro aminopeptidase|nr:aminopeptidase P family protein [Chromatiales bacterium]